jgi:hypothetical protein
VVPEQRPDRDLHLQPAQGGAQAEVRAVAAHGTAMTASPAAIRCPPSSTSARAVCTTNMGLTEV